MSLLLPDPLNLGDALKCLVAPNTASYTVYCVSWKYYNTIILETFKNFLDVSRIRIVRMYL